MKKGGRKVILVTEEAKMYDVEVARVKAKEEGRQEVEEEKTEPQKMGDAKPSVEEPQEMVKKEGKAPEPARVGGVVRAASRSTCTMLYRPQSL